MTKPGDVSEEPVIGMDFYPTILELAGLPLKPEQHVDGVSLVPLLKGGSISRENLYWHYPHYGNQGGEPSSVVRSGDWKLIYYHEDGRQELYNLKEDIGEREDLATKHPDKASELRRRLNQWLKETGARLPARDPRFNREAFDAKIRNLSTKRMQRLEAEHAEYLQPDWQPKGKEPWWGSLSD
jgi:arylsulfatase A-like enzyme